MVNEVYMDVPAVRGIAKKFSDIGQVLANIDVSLENSINILRRSAFRGVIGTAIMAQYIDTIRPYIRQMSDNTITLSKDLSTSIDAFERGDELGATRFY